MIVIETLTINNKPFIHTYSDNGYRIKQNGTGIIYDDAIDPAEMGRTYTETDELIDGGEATEADYIAALERLGVSA